MKVKAYAVLMTILISQVLFAQQSVVQVSSVIPKANAAITLKLEQVPFKTAINELSRVAGVRINYRDETLPKNIVSIDASNEPWENVARRLLKNSNLEIKQAEGGQYLLVPMVVASMKKGDGVVTGKVVDAKTGKGVSGASVSIGNDTKGMATSEDGTYRLIGVAAGEHAITVRLVGYAKQSRTITVGEGATVTVDFKLEPSASVLDQVVVTGTVVATEMKAIPNAITVITARDIEERGITQIDQLFRGDVPGVFASNQGVSFNTMLGEVVMYVRGATALSTSSIGTSFFLTNPIKTYLDGIELADSKYLSQIDPRSIERIEILTGPQASTIYGSNAINGVMQIFTKRGSSSKPQLTLNLMSGWVENNFSSARTPQHDYSTQLSGVEGRLSYSAGSAWNYMGPWTPSKQTDRTNSFGSVRLGLPTKMGEVTINTTFRYATTSSRERGSSSQAETNYREDGWYIVSSFNGLGNIRTYTLSGKTVGATLGYTPTSWWSHELGLGQDASDTDERYTARSYSSPSDTNLRLTQQYNSRRSIRYTTTARMPVTSIGQATVTVGADAWQNLVSSVSVLSQTLIGNLSGSTTINRQPGHNTGSFLQTQLSMWDRLSLTYGLRAEWNPDFGAEAQPNLAPRYGLAYTQEVGSLTTKLRASYGRSTRPPAPLIAIAQTTRQVGAIQSIIDNYGDFEIRVANPDLSPEFQQGGEGGLELYWSNHGSLVITRYNQTVDGLIGNIKVDSARSFMPNPTFADSRDADGYGYFGKQQYLNIGTIRNQGWELQGSANRGPITARGTYSWTKSRVLGITPKYRSSFPPDIYPNYQPGATFMYLPEHTWAAGITYARSQTTIAFNLMGVGQATNFRDKFFNQNLNGLIRLPYNRMRINSSGYVNFNNGYALADLAVTQRFSAAIEGLVNIQNIGGRYTNDSNASLASIGRQAKVGLRISAR